MVVHSSGVCCDISNSVILSNYHRTETCHTTAHLEESSAMITIVC